MANPNIVNVSDIRGKIKVVKLTTTNSTALISNASSSNKVLKVNFIRATNIDGINSADITITLDDDGTSGRLASTIAVPADSTLTIIGKDDSFYLEEGDSLTAITSSANDLDVICSYEEIS